MKFNMIVEKGENNWLVGQLEEIPSVISQGKTIDELRENVLDALTLYLEVQREETLKNFAGKDYEIQEVVFT
ncbi:MAG: type II toxin-antitoxin system HicB family antitoxin [Bacteroidota bacterium]|nr:type II toxin-antitoxin system HicB family antitoxin [Bacteroidota bacterium]